MVVTTCISGNEREAGCEFKEVWLKGKLEFERDVIGHSRDFILPLTPHSMHSEQFTFFDSFLCSFYFEL
jgi:hypothetical protein